MFMIGTSQHISFKVNVMGTSAEPKVRLVLATSPELSFACHRDGVMWACDASIPTGITPGSYGLRVEVVVNSRLFSPLVKQVEVEMPPMQMEPVEDVAPPAEEVMAQTAEMEHAEEVIDQPEEAIAQAAEMGPAEPPRPRYASLLKAFTPSVEEDIKHPLVDELRSLFASPIPTPTRAPVLTVQEMLSTRPALSNLQDVLDRPIVRKPRPVQPEVVQPEVVSTQPVSVKVSMLDIDRMTESRSIQQPTPAPRPVKTVPIRQGVPITLTKGSIYYE